jgi:uncharacterized membrane protein YjjP (DUF1212 family)
MNNVNDNMNNVNDNVNNVNDIMNNVNDIIDNVKDNMNNFGTLLSKTEELALITKKITVVFTEDEPPHELTTIREVHKLIGDFLSLDKVSSIVDKFNAEYTDLDPEFKDVIECPNCNHTFDFRVDMEVALFKSFLGK